MRSIFKVRFLVLLIIAVSGYLALRGLTNYYFWDDEAETALFSRNLLQFGCLTAWDGRNLIARRNGIHLDREWIERFNSPLQFYLTAASFQLIGKSTAAVRLPFILLGLTSLLLFYSVLKLESGDKVLFGGRLDKTTELPIGALRELNPSLIVEDARPDWIISFRLRPTTMTILDCYAIKIVNLTYTKYLTYII